MNVDLKGKVHHVTFLSLLGGGDAISHLASQSEVYKVTRASLKPDSNQIFLSYSLYLLHILSTVYLYV